MMARLSFVRRVLLRHDNVDHIPPDEIRAQNIPLLQHRLAKLRSLYWLVALAHGTTIYPRGCAVKIRKIIIVALSVFGASFILFLLVSTP
jgi:hypothetical protein